MKRKYYVEQGKEYNWFTAVEELAGNLWRCKCRCGTEKIIAGSHLVKGRNFSCKNCPKIDLTGRRFGKLVVTGYAGKLIGPHGGGADDHRWHCQCDCGNEIIRCFRSFSSKMHDRMSCGCIRIASESCAWKGYGDISGQKWLAIQKGAAKRKLSFEITIEYAWKLFLKQNRKCALTGWDLTMYYPGEERYRRADASLDRIDSSKGYIEGNLQWVHKSVNLSKWDATQEHFITMCKAVAENFKDE